MHTTPAVNAGHHAHDVGITDTFDFLNTDDTDDGVPNEKLPTLDAALDWFVDRGVIHGEGAEGIRVRAKGRPEFAEAELVRVHAVRDALREVAQSIVEHRAADPAALHRVNRALHARQVIELVPSTDGVNVDHRHVGNAVDDALARLSDALVVELTSGHPERIRQCDAHDCWWFFYDDSRTQRRRWCNMATCGNRAKAARYRARARSGEVPSGEMPAIEIIP